MFKNKPFWFSLAMIAVYLLLGYFAVPPILHPRLEQFAAGRLGLAMQFDRLQFDPITWSVDLIDVRLDPVDSTAWPGLTLTADALHLRFNFWRLQPAISDLILRSPQLDIAAGHELMSSGPYPFGDQWQKWQARHARSGEPGPVPIQHGRVENGRVQVIGRESSLAAQVLLDKVYAQIGKADSAGLRAYQLAFSTAAPRVATVQLKGRVMAGSEDSSGSYQLDMLVPSGVAGLAAGLAMGQTGTGSLPDGESVNLRLEGAFKATVQSDRFLIELGDSRIRQRGANADDPSSASIPDAAGAAVCVMDGLLCAAASPLQGNFSATLNARLWAATDGIHLLQAESELTGFALDTFLAQGRVELGDQQQINSARIRFISTAEPAGDLQPEAENPADHSDIRFEADLQAVNGDNHSLQGQFTRAAGEWKTGMANIQFTMTGSHAASGQLQLQSHAATVLRDAYAQLTLELDNPSASFARGFLKEHLSGAWVAGSLNMQLTGSVDDAALNFTESIHLLQLEPDADSTAGSSSTIKPENNSPKTGASLLAWLQNPQGDVVLNLPEYQLPLTESYRLEEVLQAPVVGLLKSFHEQPLEALAAQLGFAGEDLSEIRFRAGMAALDINSSATLNVLAQVLLQRPALALEWAGVFDPLIDRKALQTEQVRTHIALAMAADLSFQSGSVPPDFTDPIVHSVIDEFARRRLPPKVLAAFTEHFGAADADQGLKPEGDAAAYYSTLFELLVDHAEIPQGALTTLARYRAQAVADSLGDQGVPAGQWQIAGEPQTVSARLEGVPMPMSMSTNVHGHGHGQPEDQLQGQQLRKLPGEAGTESLLDNDSES